MRADRAANILMVTMLTCYGTDGVAHGGEVRVVGFPRIPFGQHIEYGAPSFRVDARVRIPMNGASNGRHQILGYAPSVIRTQCVGE